MDEFSREDGKLHADEKQMRRALGLDTGHLTASTPQPHAPSPIGQARHPRRFVREGEVPVTMISHDHESSGGMNRLRAAQQAIQEQIAAREKVEQQLAEAQVTIYDLQTKLGHHQLARQEEVGRAEANRQSLEREIAALREALDAERAGRVTAEQERDQALLWVQKAQDSAVIEAPDPIRRKRGRPPSMKEAAPSEAPARRDRPPKAASKAEPPSDDSEIVEWWIPGWQERYYGSER